MNDERRRNRPYTPGGPDGKGRGAVPPALEPVPGLLHLAKAESLMLDITARPEIMTEPRFRLRLFGQFRLAGASGRIELNSRKLAGLLAYLACASPEPQPRDKVMTLMWGSYPEPRAQQSLRQALMRLRRVLGEDAIVGGRDRVGIRPGLVDCDVAAFERLIATQSLGDALQLYAGPFLADVSLAEEEWEVWARAQQSRLDALALDAALTLATAELDAGRSPRALEAAQRALAIDNLREDAHRLVITALAAVGRRADALKHFEDLTALLRTELDVAPEPETHRLVQQIRLAGSLPAAPATLPARDPAPPLPLPERPSIAVLPFADGSETDQRYFADGIIEDIVLSLPA